VVVVVLPPEEADSVFLLSRLLLLSTEEDSFGFESLLRRSGTATVTVGFFLSELGTFPPGADVDEFELFPSFWQPLPLPLPLLPLSPSDRSFLTLTIFFTIRFFGMVVDVAVVALSSFFDSVRVVEVVDSSFGGTDAGSGFLASLGFFPAVVGCESSSGFFLSGNGFPWYIFGSVVDWWRFSIGSFLSKGVFVLLLLLVLVVVVVGSFLLSSLILGLGSLPLPPPPPPNSDFVLLVDPCCFVGGGTLSLSFLSFPPPVVKQGGGCIGSDASNFLLSSPVCLLDSLKKWMFQVVINISVFNNYNSPYQFWIIVHLTFWDMRVYY
jgi:hypothetical protein